ncbi:unnamed protein product [Dovyalis caffra]|uniref:Transmembrane protein n=1 Tax=Dovyalis caffra TaxID=77055 RepID=A0AAV1SJH9_9ROSI|nr:unnamed protein product [Dovyalis caffra]
MEKDKQIDVSSAQAVLLGALAPGVNGPTWNTLKSAFFLLGLCLAVMLGLAFSSSDSSLVLHVGFLVIITATLFLLLSCVGLWNHNFGNAMYLIFPLGLFEAWLSIGSASWGFASAWCIDFYAPYALVDLSEI